MEGGAVDSARPAREQGAEGSFYFDDDDYPWPWNWSRNADESARALNFYDEVDDGLVIPSRWHWPWPFPPPIPPVIADDMAPVEYDGIGGMRLEGASEDDADRVTRALRRGAKKAKMDPAAGSAEKVKVQEAAARRLLAPRNLRGRR